MVRFQYSIYYVTGKYLIIADKLSQAPTAGPTPAHDLFQEEANAFLSAVLGDIPATEQQIWEI